MRKLLLGVVALVLLTAGRPAPAASPAPLNRPIKAPQVACAARQLGRLQRRMAVYGGWVDRFSTEGLVSRDPGGSILALSHATLGGGVFSGLARTIDLGPSPCLDFQAGRSRFSEADLAFELLFKERTALLDPGRPRIPQATLVRRDWGTNFGIDHADCYTPDVVQPALTCPIILSLDLAAQEGDRLVPQLPILLNGARMVTPGLTNLGAIPRASAVGRGPGVLNDDLSEACGGVLTDFDQRVFEILARTILPSDTFLRLVPPRQCDGVPLPFGYSLAIFRGADPHIYRVNVDLYEHNAEENLANDIFDRPALALEMRMNWDSEGRLTTGTARILPQCKGSQDLDCTGLSGGLALFIVPPIFPGHEEEPPAAFHNAPYLNYAPPSPAANVLTTTIDWADLLKNTALNEP